MCGYSILHTHLTSDGSCVLRTARTKMGLCRQALHTLINRSTVTADAGVYEPIHFWCSLDIRLLPALPTVPLWLLQQTCYCNDCDVLDVLYKNHECYQCCERHLQPSGDTYLYGFCFAAASAAALARASSAARSSSATLAA